jgi:hypothetical protein
MAGSSHVKPGDKRRITVKIGTAGRKGPITENVEISSNDPVRPTVMLTIKAFAADTDIPFVPQ